MPHLVSMEDPLAEYLTWRLGSLPHLVSTDGDRIDTFDHIMYCNPRQGGSSGQSVISHTVVLNAPLAENDSLEEGWVVKR